MTYRRKDTYHRRARAAGYRARSAYKLAELADRFQVLCLTRQERGTSLAQAGESLEISRDSQTGADVFPGHHLHGWFPSDARIEACGRSDQKAGRLQRARLRRLESAERAYGSRKWNVPLGQSLLAATAGNLQQRNFSMLSLTVTEANTHAVDLYRHLGFDIKRVFDAFVWEG